MIFGLSWKELLEFAITVLNTILIFMTKRQSAENGAHLARIERLNNRG